MDPVTIFAALAPFVVDLGKSLVAKYVAPDEFKPSTIEQYTAMRALDLEMFKVMNAAPANTYPWVAAIREVQRPLVVFVVFGTWAAVHMGWAALPAGIEPATLENLAGAVGVYLFGDRTLFYSRKAGAK
jgi:hypothetical protein